MRAILALFAHSYWAFILLFSLLIMIVQIHWHQGISGEEQVIQIESGAHLGQIAGQLDDAELVRWAPVFSLFVRLNGRGDEMRAGEYAIPAQSSAYEIMEILTRGRSIQYSITIAEGLTSFQIVALLNADARLSGDIDTIPAEGTLLPETYFFTRGTSAQEIIARMTRDMESVLQELWPQRIENLPLETPEEAVILASIVEKETGVAQERPMVASVFINRLNIDMRLQTDPTVIYAVTNGETSLGRRLTRSDLQTDSPYNTYLYGGLPPTPIANPGRAALEAVLLHPANTPYLYFVADGTGGHAFAETLAEHNQNVARWREIRDQ